MKISLPEEYTTRVEMLPLIDIVFLLLVFFIYAMLSMAVHRGMEVELPVSSTAEAEKETTLAVTVRSLAAGGIRVYVNEVPVDLPGLAVLLRETAKQEQTSLDRSPGVLLFADKQVDYQQLFKVLDQINRSGLTRVSLQADVERQ